MAFVMLGIVTTGVAYVLSTVLKDVVQEVRPCRAIAGVQTIETCPTTTDWSLPSNHAVLAAVGAVALILIWRQLAWAAVPLALAEGASRVYVGVHYPHDVLAGFALGAAVGLGALLVARPATVIVHRLRSWTVFAPVLGGAVAASVAGSVRPRRVEAGAHSGTYRSDFARW
jgi:undecaprenyl-diphosphatase